MSLTSLTLAPRYRLDDELPWLEGIDPARHYWIAVNGDGAAVAPVPGLVVSSVEQLRVKILEFRNLQRGESMAVERIAGGITIHCITRNCYAIATTYQQAPVWHLFDRETLESLLMTAHPDWTCSEKDLELGRRLLAASLQATAA